MEININMSFEWWNSSDNHAEISQDHQEYLTNAALERINEMRKEFYIGGELNAEIDGLNYRGSWSYNECLPIK